MKLFRPSVEKQEVITSKDIQNDMSLELKYILGQEEIGFYEDEQEKVNQFVEFNKYILDKASTLNSLGFVNTPSVKKSEEVKSKKEEKNNQILLKKEEVELVAKYKLQFPFYKFIPESVYEKVMEKYDLFKANPNRYIKEIPNKNLEEIANFDKLVENTYQKIYTDSTTSFIMHGEFTEEEYEIEKIKLKNRNYISSLGMVELKKKNKFEITAPINHFNLGASEIKNRQINDKVEDLLVTHKVKGGYIIVSVWDKEADIPEIKNENLN